MSKSLKLSLAIIVAAAVTLVIALVATNDGDPDTEPTTGNADQTSELLVRDDSPRLTSGTEAPGLDRVWWTRVMRPFGRPLSGLSIASRTQLG